MKKKYITVTAASLFDLETAVNIQVDEGYEVTGGVSASPNPQYINKGGYYYYHQALVLNKTTQTNKKLLLESDKSPTTEDKFKDTYDHPRV
jgi:hypothetical protein